MRKALNLMALCAAGLSATLGGGCLADESTPDEAPAPQATPGVQASTLRSGVTIHAADLRLAAGLAATDFGFSTQKTFFVEPGGNPLLTSNLVGYATREGFTSSGINVLNQLGNASPLPAYNPTFAPEQDALVQVHSAMTRATAATMIQTQDATDANLAAGITKAVALGADLVIGGWALPAGSAPLVEAAIAAAPPSVRFVFAAPGAGAGLAASSPSRLAKVMATGGSSLSLTPTVSESLWSSSPSGCASGITPPAGQPAVAACLGGRAYPDSIAPAQSISVRVATSPTTFADIVMDGTALAAPQAASHFARSLVDTQVYSLAASKIRVISTGNNGQPAGQPTVGVGRILGGI